MLFVQSIIIGIVCGITYALVTYYDKLQEFRRYLKSKERNPQGPPAAARITFLSTLRGILRLVGLVCVVSGLLYTKLVLPLPFTASFILSFIGSMYYLVKRPLS